LFLLGLARHPKSNPADIKVFIHFWDLWWKVWHLEMFFCQYFGFPLTVSFHKDTTAMYSLPTRCNVTKQFAATIKNVLKILGQPIGAGYHEIFVTWRKVYLVWLGITWTTGEASLGHKRLLKKQ
jgi:hypothetical protein